MTPEAALAKVAYVLGCCKDNAARRRILSHDLRGEITLPPRPRNTPEDESGAVTFDLHTVPSGQVGINQLAARIGGVMVRAGKDGPSNIWADRLFPYLFCAAAEADDVAMLTQLFSITKSLKVRSAEACVRPLIHT